MKTVMSKGELARIRASILPPVEDHSRQERKAQLKAKSDARVRNWPNTLEALRLKKESYLKDKEAEEELRRQEIDREEAELRRKSRLEAIRKANDLIYAETDKMKLLRSQSLYADVIATRYEQIDFKKKVKEDEKVAEVGFHDNILKEVARLKAIEEAKVEKTKVLVSQIKVSRQEQLEEVRKARASVKAAEIAEGIKAKEKAEVELEEELRIAEEKKKVAAANNMRMLKANADLKTVRMQLHAAERAAEAERDAQVEGIEARKVALKRLEKERFEKSQLTRQRLIDAAVEQLAKKSGRENAVMARQAQDMKDKEDARLAAKEAMLKADYETCVASRTEQVERKRREDSARKIEDDRLVAKWKRENEEAIQAEIDKQNRARQETIRIKSIQKLDGEEARRKKEEDRLREIEQTRFLQSIDVSDESRFVELCKAEIERNIKLGKPVYTLLRALEYSAPPLLAAKINPIDRNNIKKDD